MGLREITFKELYDSGKLPSGAEFELMPDTVETALRVAEVHDPSQWKRKALQAFVVTKKVDRFDVQEMGPSFVHNMLDTDVTFLSLAWTTQMNGTSMGLDGGVPCPTCGVNFTKVDFGDLKLRCRDSAAGGPDGMFKVDIDDSEVPDSLKGADIFVTDPTWQLSKSRLTDGLWSSPDAVLLHRMMNCLRASSGGQSPRALSSKGEVTKLRSSVIPKITNVMNENIPSFIMQLEMKCDHCTEVAIVPFEQAL